MGPAAVAGAAMSSLFEACGALVAPPSSPWCHPLEEQSPLNPKQVHALRDFLLCVNHGRPLCHPASKDGYRRPPSRRCLGRHSNTEAEQESRRERMRAQLEDGLEELFNLHDLNRNGLLEELELIKLNEKIAMLHYGKDADRAAVRAKYQELFRSHLDAEGQPIEFPTFRDYMFKVLEELDQDSQAQGLILEQFIAEARSGRFAFHCKSFYSVSDEPFRPPLETEELSSVSIDSEMPLLPLQASIRRAIL
jgi:hypothetical protein